MNNGILRVLTIPTKLIYTHKKRWKFQLLRFLTWKDKNININLVRIELNGWRVFHEGYIAELMLSSFAKPRDELGGWLTRYSMDI
jgi:hypothetical protein